MSPSRLRDQFLLDPEIVFLNHGSFGACPRPVFERYQAWQRELERRPVEFLARRLPELLDDVRARLAAYVGSRRPDDLLWRHVCARAGARYVQAELPLPAADPDAIVDGVLARVTHRTRALFVSHVTSPTAIVLPVAELPRGSAAF